MTPPKTIAIDGLAGSGKTTVGRLLAQRLDYAFIDTGRFYRMIARAILNNHINPADEKSVVDYAANMKIEVTAAASGGKLKIVIDGDDVDAISLHSPEINATVPVTSAYRGVRQVVRKIQRQVAESGRVIIAGRDIGTVVLPNAELKVFLAASIDERTRRIYTSKYKDQPVEAPLFDKLKQDTERRDEMDIHREESPAVAAADALVIETEGILPEAIVARVFDHIQNRA